MFDESQYGHEIKEAMIFMPLKLKQLEALVHFTEGKDTFVALPTVCMASQLSLLFCILY